MRPTVALILPCYNEEISIGKTIQQFKTQLPDATIYVCDNGSTDATAQVAQKHGAQVLFEPLKGKGNAVRRLFQSVDADIYIMADGDGTYDSTQCGKMIELLQEKKLDMVVGKRKEAGHGVIYRTGHRFGNRMFNFFLRYLFTGGFSDIFSGYRVFSKRFVKSFPVDSKGFEIETEISIHCLSLKLSFLEIDTDYFAREEGSTSKLNKHRDGILILSKMIRLFIEYKPFLFFFILFLIFLTMGTVLFVPVFLEFLQTHTVPRFPSLIVAVMFYILALVNFVFGIILHYISKMRIEFKKLSYLSIGNE